MGRLGEHSFGHAGIGSMSLIDSMKTAANTRKLSVEFSTLVERVRKEVPGHENFLLPHRFDYLKAAAKHGPVVILLHDSEHAFSLYLVHKGSGVDRDHVDIDIKGIRLKELEPPEPRMRLLAEKSLRTVASSHSAEAGAEEGSHTTNLHDADSSVENEAMGDSLGSGELTRAGKRVERKAPLTLKDSLESIWNNLVKIVLNELGLKVSYLLLLFFSLSNR